MKVVQCAGGQRVGLFLGAEGGSLLDCPEVCRHGAAADAVPRSS